jgi:AraC-like DNA-binding protein
MQVAGIGRILFWQGGSLWIGLSTAPVPPHAHHAIQLTFGLRGRLRFRLAGAPSWGEYSAALIPTDIPHEFEADGSLVAHVFVEPETPPGRALARRFGSAEIRGLPEGETDEPSRRLLELHEAGAKDAELIAVVRDAVSLLADAADPPEPADPRVLGAIGEARRRLDEPISLEEVAAHVRLSPDRFRHLFVAETGLPFRTYLLWLRLERAISVFAAGGSWTEAAHAANFADSAHLSRTLRRMFGIAPSALRRMKVVPERRRAV